MKEQEQSKTRDSRGSYRVWLHRHEESAWVVAWVLFRLHAFCSGQANGAMDA